MMSNSSSSACSSKLSTEEKDEAPSSSLKGDGLSAALKNSVPSVPPAMAAGMLQV